MTHYTNRSCQRAAGDKNWRPNNFFVSCVIYAYISIKICIIVYNNKKSPKRNNIFLHIWYNKLNSSVSTVSVATKITEI